MSWCVSFSAYTTMTHTRTLRSTEEDKNSNKHSVRLSKRERERRPEWERQQWRDTCRQAGWDMWCPAVNWAGLEMCLVAFWATEISSLFIIPHAACLSRLSVLSVWLETDRQASAKFACLCAPVWRDWSKRSGSKSEVLCMKGWKRKDGLWKDCVFSASF